MKSWRKAQPKMPRPPKQKITASQIEITEVTDDTPPLVKHDSQYRVIHERLLASQPGARFRVALGNEYLTRCARASLHGFARRNGIAITTLLAGKQIEVTRKGEEA